MEWTKFFQINTTENKFSDEATSTEVPEEDEGETQTTLDTDTTNMPDEPVISLHALTNISSPQNLKIQGFIKHQLVVVLIDSGSTHNFVYKRVVEVVHCFVRAVSHFQGFIVDVGTMKCEEFYENIKLQMGDYHLKTQMFAMEMGGCDIFLGAIWLHTLVPIIMEFHEIYVSFKQNDHTYTLRGL